MNFGISHAARRIKIKEKEITKMKKLMSVVVSILFALSLSSFAFAQAKEAKPAAEPVKAEEKAPAKEKKAKKAPKAKKAKKAEKKGEEAPAPAPEKK